MAGLHSGQQCIAKPKTFDRKQELRQLFFLISLAVIIRFTFYPFFTVDGRVQPLICKNINTFRKMTLTGTAISLAIEFLQLPFAVQASDVDDRILNTASCIVGYRIYPLVRWIRKTDKK